MENTESKLYEAALTGNTTTLRELLRQDRLILDRVILMNRPSYKTPLHVAAFLGHGDFVREILEVNPDMCLARDVDGRNPLHLAAMKGRTDVLEELVRVRPLAASATTLCGETILHLCVKHKQLLTLKFLLEKHMNELHHLLNSKDDYGMTILHLAAADKQKEAIEFILTIGKGEIEVNSLNACGFTPLRILALSKGHKKISEIEKLLRNAKAMRAIKQDDWLENMRSAILVVASLIATVAFQAAVNPPRSPSEDESSNPQAYVDFQAAAPRSYYIRNWIEESFFDLKQEFILFNTVAFLASVSTILMLISGLPLSRKLVLWVFLIIMWAAITAMTFTYTTALGFLFDRPYRLYPSDASSYIVFIWMSVGGLLLLSHIIRVTIKVIKYLQGLSWHRLRNYQWKRSLWSIISSMNKCPPKFERRSPA